MPEGFMAARPPASATGEPRREQQRGGSGAQDRTVADGQRHGAQRRPGPGPEGGARKKPDREEWDAREHGQTDGWMDEVKDEQARSRK